MRVEPQVAGADHAGQPEAAGDHGGVAGHAAADGQHPARRVHAADVLGAGLDAGEDRRLVLRGGGVRRLGGEDDAAGRRAGAGGDPGAEDVAPRGRVDLRVQVLDQAARLDAEQRLGAGDGAGVGEIDGDAHGGAGVAADRHRVDDGRAAVAQREVELVGVAEAGGGGARRGGQRGQRRGGELLERGRVLAGGAAGVAGQPARGCASPAGLEGAAHRRRAGRGCRRAAAGRRRRRRGPPRARAPARRARAPPSSGAPLARRRMRAEGAFQARAMARAAASSCSRGSVGNGWPASSAKWSSIASMRLRSAASSSLPLPFSRLRASASKSSGSRPCTAWAKAGMARRCSSSAARSPMRRASPGSVAGPMPRFRSALGPPQARCSGLQRSASSRPRRQGEVGHRAAVGERAHAVEGERDPRRDRQAERGQPRELRRPPAVGGVAHRLAGIEGDDGVGRRLGDLLRFHCSAA